MKFHVDFTAASQVIPFDIFGDAGGAAFAPLPIPNDPSLVGKQYFAQSFWVEAAADGQACSHAVLSLVSSTGLALTVQP